MGFEGFFSPATLANFLMTSVADFRSGDFANLEGGGTGDNFNELASDDGLSGPVEGDSQFVNHLTWNKRAIRLEL